MQGTEAIDSEVILREHADALAVLLWKAVRAVRVWSNLSGADRSSAFARGAYESREELFEAAGVPAEIAVALDRTGAVLQKRARSGTVASACRDIAEWAVAQGTGGTAIEFMQAAAVTMPDDAELAHQVARLARRRRELSRAETWYREGIARGRRAKSWRDFAASYTGLGSIYSLRGNYSQANRNLLRGLRAARRFSIRPLAARAAHELGIVAIRRRRGGDLVRFGRMATDAYGAGHARLPALARDIAGYLIGEGHFEGARRILEAVDTTELGPFERNAHLASLVDLYSALGDREALEDSLEEWRSSRADGGTARDLNALLSVARGTAATGLFDDAVAAAQEAVELAGESGDEFFRADAEKLLSAASENSYEAATESKAPRPLDNLATKLANALLTG